MTSVVGNKLELVQEVRRYQLYEVRLTSMHIKGSGAKHLERGWTVSFPGVAQGERYLGMFTSPTTTHH